MVTVLDSDLDEDPGYLKSCFSMDQDHLNYKMTRQLKVEL